MNLNSLKSFLFSAMFCSHQGVSYSTAQCILVIAACFCCPSGLKQHVCEPQGNDDSFLLPLIQHPALAYNHQLHTNNKTRNPSIFCVTRQESHYLYWAFSSQYLHMFSEHPSMLKLSRMYMQEVMAYHIKTGYLV